MSYFFQITGIALTLDGIISIALATPSNVTWKIFNWNPKIIVFLGHLFRMLRIAIGVSFLLITKDVMNYSALIGTFLFLSGVFSILTANKFKHWTDYWRIILMAIGAYLIIYGIN